MKSGASGRYVVLVLSLLLGLCAPLAGLRFVGFLLFLLITSATAYNILARSALTVRRLDPLVRGARLQALPARLVVRNGLPVPLPRLIVSESPGMLECERANRELTLPIAGAAEIVEKIRGGRRGEYAYGPARLKGSDPFGLFEWELERGGTARAVVYPRIYPIALINRRGVAGGNLRVTDPAYEDMTRFRALREYVGGDELKRVNWKASAKTGRLFTTEYEQSLTVGVRIVLNLRADDYPTRRRDQMVERAVEAAAALLLYYARLGQPVGLVAAARIGEQGPQTIGVQGGGSPPAQVVVCGEKTGWPHSERILEVLARLAPSSGTVDYLSVIHRGGRGTPSGLRLIVIGPKPRPQQVLELKTVRSGRIRVELFEIQPADQNVGFQGSRAEGTGIASRERGSDQEAGALTALEGVIPVYRVSDYGEEILER